jgi:hypothetical protein
MSALSDPRSKELLTFHRAFWGRELTSTPLVATGIVGRYSRLGMFYHPDLPLEGYFSPDMIRVDELINRYQRWFERDGILENQVFRLASVEHTVCWLEAILGCPIRYSFVHDTMWAEESADRVWPPPLPDVTTNPWFKKLIELSQAFDQAFHGRFPIGTLQLRGATDLLGAYLGGSQLCLLAYDDPEGLQTAVSRTTELCLQVAQAQLTAIRPVQGGYFNYFQVWAPGTTVVWSQDLSTLFSPEMYGEFFLPFDRRLAGVCQYPLLHVHTSELHCFPLWAEIEGLNLEVTVDSTGTTLAEILPLLDRLQEQKIALMVQVQNNQELELAQSALSPQGLHLATRYQPGRPSVFEDLRIND